MIIEIENSTFKIKRINAVDGIEMLSSENYKNIIFHTSILKNGEWVNLDCNELLDKHLPSWEALVELESTAIKENFGFLDSWRPVRVPAEMDDGKFHVSSRHSNSIISALISSDMATLLELKTQYTVEDAFKLLDILTAKNVNEWKATRTK